MTIRPDMVAGHLCDLAMFHGSLVGVGSTDEGLGVIWSSPDGRTWMSNAGAAQLDGTLLRSVAVGDSGIVTVGWNDAGSVVIFAADGSAWSPQSVPGNHFGSSIMSVAWGHGRYVAVGGGGEPDAAVSWTSEDGRTWTRILIIEEGQGASLNSVVAGPDGFVAGGRQSGLDAVWISPDGITWTEHSLPGSPDGDPGRLGFTGGRFFMPDRGGVWTSVDAIDWTWTAMPGTWLGVFDVIAVSGGFVAVGRLSAGSQPAVVAVADQEASGWRVLPADRALNGVIISTLAPSRDGASLVGVGIDRDGGSGILLADPVMLLSSQ